MTPYFSDPDGDALTYAVSSSDTQVVAAFVSDSTLTVEALGPGTVRLTVTASDPAGLQATQGASVQGGILTAVLDIEAFLDRCPTSDSAFVDVRTDFEVRFAGEPISDPIVCSEPGAGDPRVLPLYALPMYVAVPGTITAWAILYMAPVLWACGGLVFVFFSLFIRFYEEPRLTREFGDDYAAYMEGAGRWLPRPGRRNLGCLPASTLSRRERCASIWSLTTTRPTRSRR